MEATANVETTTESIVRTLPGWRFRAQCYRRASQGACWVSPHTTRDGAAMFQSRQPPVFVHLVPCRHPSQCQVAHEGGSSAARAWQAGAMEGRARATSGRHSGKETNRPKPWGRHLISNQKYSQIILIIILFISELRNFLVVRREDTITIDNTLNEKLQINFNISLYEIPCDSSAFLKWLMC